MTVEHGGREYLDAAFGAQETHRRACIEDAKQDPASVWFEGPRPRADRLTDPPAGLAYIALCEKWGHSGGRLGEKCRAMIDDDNGKGRRYGCQSLIVAYNPATGRPMAKPEADSTPQAAPQRPKTGPITVSPPPAGACCVSCGIRVTDRRGRAKFCSNACRQKTKRRRARTGKKAA